MASRMITHKTMTYDTAGPIARITLNRPDRGNGITLETPAELSECVERANLDPAVHVIALSGNGKGFCGGYDLVASAEHVIGLCLGFARVRDRFAFPVQLHLGSGERLRPRIDVRLLGGYRPVYLRSELDEFGQARTSAVRRVQDSTADHTSKVHARYLEPYLAQLDPVGAEVAA